MANSLNSEINKLTRVLATGEARMKFTIRINFPDGRAVEWQSDEPVNVGWNQDLREPWLYHTSNYRNCAIMKWTEGSIVICERNKDVKD
jgi:hypothetical protein